MNCVLCGGDIDEMGMDNVSPICGYPMCESCAEITGSDEELRRIYEKENE